MFKKIKFYHGISLWYKKTVEGEVGPLKLSLGENFNCSMGFYVVPHYRDWEVMLGVDFLEDTKSLIQFGRDTTYLILEDGTKIKSIESSISSLNRKDTELPKEKENYSYVIDQEEEEPTPDWEDEFEILKTKNVDKAHLGQVVLPDFPELTERFDNLFNEYIDLFATQLSDLEISSLEKFQIIIENTLPQYQHYYRRNEKESVILKNIIDDLLKNKMIRNSKSPWGAPCFVVKKPNDQHRMVVDYRKLNKVTKAHPFPLPRLIDIFDKLSHAKYFTTLDLKSGFHQIGMNKDSIEMTAFTTPFGHFEWNVLPFGLKNAPSEFCRNMYKVFNDLKSVLIYLDDICIYTETAEEHLDVLKEVFRRLRKAKLKVNINKCHWMNQRIKLLGHFIENGKIEMDASKIEAIINRKAPNNVKEVQVYLGLCNFYRRFFKDFAAIVKPLTNLLNKKNKWVWGEECQKAFKETKLILTAFPVLRLPDNNKRFILYTDASKWALGVILGQIDENGEEYVCAYASRVLRGAEKNLSITELECLAVIYGLKEFRIYLLGEPFKLYTDHSALTWLLNIKDSVGKLYRWAVMIQQFDMEIIYKKGSKHLNADTLSRPVMSFYIEQEKYEQDIFLNKALSSFIRLGIHASNSTHDQIKQIESDARHYKLESETFYYRKNENERTYIEVPNIEERDKIVLNYHSREHSDYETIYDQIKSKYFWYNMLEEIRNKINKCQECNGYTKVDVYLNTELLDFIKTKIHATYSSLTERKLIELGAQHYKVKLGILYYRKLINEDIFVVVPKIEDRPELIIKFHLLGHAGIESTYRRIKDAYFWFRMINDIKIILKTCEACHRNKKSRCYNHPAQSIYADQIFEFISVDYVFGLEKTEKGNTGIIIITDKVSKWCRARAVSDKSENTTYKMFREWILDYCPPKIILSDNGTEFKNTIIKKLCLDYGIEQRFTASYFPRCNGQVERLNQTLIRSLRTHSENNIKNWDNNLDWVVFAYNTRVHSTTLYSPFELVFGIKPNLFQSNTVTNSELNELKQREWEIENNKIIKENANKNADSASETQRKNQDKNQNVIHKVLQEGTTVMIKEEGILKKLS